MDLLDRIASKVLVSPSACWLWTDKLTDDGYGRLRVGKRRPMAHRAVYEALVEPIPAGLTIDHLCRVRHCVNPDHLEPVTLLENLLRGTNITTLNRAKTRCKHGHRFSPSNTRVVNGHRVCITCARRNNREYARRRYAQQKRAS